MKHAIFDPMTAPENSNSPVSGLARVRTLTGLSMLFERLWPLLLPSIITAALLITLSWAGLFRALPEMARIGFLSALGVGFIASLWPLRAFRFPSSAEITARIEAGQYTDTPANHRAG